LTGAFIRPKEKSAMTAPAPRLGRPLRPVSPTETKRVPLGLRVLPETKALVDALAVRTGRTQSAQCEFLIERALMFDKILSAVGYPLNEAQRLASKPVGDQSPERERVEP
jgi:hypothetical protein